MKFYKYPATDIPSVFIPYGADEPFSNCIQCDCNLLEDDVEYVVEKAIRKYKQLNASDVIFEYAMCLPCAERLRKELSENSLLNIQRYMANSNLIDSRRQLIEQNNWNIEDWLSNCAVNGEEIEKQEEYHIYGHCRGRQMVFSAMPYMISGSAVEEMAELLSAKTRDELDRFIDDNFGIPPELKEPIKNNPIMLI